MDHDRATTSGSESSPRTRIDARVPRDASAARVVLISTYDCGHQPFGLASPAAWLRREGFDVRLNDLAVEALDESAIAGAALVAFYLPMHTATRLALRALDQVRAIGSGVPVGFFGLYAAMNEPLLRSRGAAFVAGGEFEESLVRAARRIVAGEPVPASEVPRVSHQRLAFLAPERSGLPPLARYARLRVGDEERVTGYTEASRGCRHRCRHCPVVPVYDGRFRIVPREVVLEDVARQVDVVQELHRRFPDLTYDVTIKIEHLLHHAQHLPELRDTGCAFVTSAVESLDDGVLATLEKGHTRADVEEVVRRCREAGLPLQPTFVAFTPWTTVRGYQDLLDAIADLGLIDHVAPVQLAIRLLIPAGSRLLELAEVRDRVEPFDPVALVYRWRHADPEVDHLQREIEAEVVEATGRGEPRAVVFRQILARVEARTGRRPRRLDSSATFAAAPIPFMTEPWYCCAEPLPEPAMPI